MRTVSSSLDQIRSLLFAVVVGLLLIAATANAQSNQPNILVVFGDDIGITNVSA